jgi:hypothetical protein
MKNSKKMVLLLTMAFATMISAASVTAQAMDHSKVPKFNWDITQLHGKKFALIGSVVNDELFSCPGATTFSELESLRTPRQKLSGVISLDYRVDNIPEVNCLFGSCMVHLPYFQFKLANGETDSSVWFNSIDQGASVYAKKGLGIDPNLYYGGKSVTYTTAQSELIKYEDMSEGPSRKSMEISYLKIAFFKQLNNGNLQYKVQLKKDKSDTLKTMVDCFYEPLN